MITPPDTQSASTPHTVALPQAVQRRTVLRMASATALGALGTAALAQSFDFKPNQRYPDPAVLILDPSFAKYRIYSSTLEQVGSGMRWAEGPVYFPGETAGAAGYLLCSDIPNNRMMKFDEATNKFSVHKENANYANGNTRDRQGRLISCEHSITRRVVRTEKDGKMTVLADSFEGKKLNAPNDIVVKSDDSVSNKTKLIDAADNGALDGFRVDRDGNLWCGWGSNGALQAEPTEVGGTKVFQLKGKSEDLDGVKIFNASGKPIGFIRLPERCANVEFGGPKRNRLYMTSCHSLYALYVESHGAV
jgi:sugar lactone lactonase YvrE